MRTKTKFFTANKYFTFDMKGDTKMIMYYVEPWNEDEEPDTLCLTYSEAREFGNEYCPSGYDIEEVDTDDMLTAEENI